MPLANPVTANPPGAASSLTGFGHSFFYQPVGQGVSTTSQAVSPAGQMLPVLAAALNIAPQAFRNLAVSGSSLTQPGRGDCGYARILAETIPPKKTYPTVRYGGMYAICHGINDVAVFGTGALVASRFKDAMRMAISRFRASSVWLANDADSVPILRWTFGANFTAAASTFLAFTSGNARRATVVDTAGSSTATFTIPLGYKGEPLAFTFLYSAGATGGDITWGGTVTGTSGIVGTVTNTDSGGVAGTYGLGCVRFTAATNGLSAKNAGQTITLKVTRLSAGGEIIIDSAWIEAGKPCPVIVNNISRPACGYITLALGDVVTTSGSATITSATAEFLSGTDVGGQIIETDAQGAFTAGKTINAVTNSTTATMSATAAASKTNVEVTLQRIRNGYAAYGGSGTTNFQSATVASHAAADADIATGNSWITSVVAEFDSMVQIADIDSAIGQDSQAPTSNVYSFYGPDGLHVNELGAMECAEAMFNAVTRLAAADPFSLTVLQVPGVPTLIPGPIRRPAKKGTTIGPEFGSFSTYTCVAGDEFAVPIVVTEAGGQWGQWAVQQTNAPATAGSSLRAGLYDDPNWSGYPQQKTFDIGPFALGTTAGQKNLQSVFWSLIPGLYWYVLKVDALGTTASQITAVGGFNPYMPVWPAGGVTGTIYNTLHIGWKRTGVAAGAMSTFYPTGAALTGTAPLLAITVVA